eukprot:TRINITY_DN13867_c0_g1_i1.p1 TRINITY_DN13867_c0_g1~~TRINITY_DN13867_c0_g1_i1.p1  ORF type:complete len:497 (+),score=225.83 TRINITY_DN13867_c0_g1_i1:75-1565(+)
MIDVENFDECKTEEPLFDSPRSLFACKQLGVTQQSLLNVPFGVFLSKAKSEDEARLRHEHWRKKRMRLLADVRCRRQDNIQKGVEMVPTDPLHCLATASCAPTPSFAPSFAGTPSASLGYGATPRSVMSGSVRLGGPAGLLKKPKQFNMNHVETYMVEKPAVYRREEENIEKRRQLLEKIQKKESEIPERQKVRKAIRAAPAADHNARWEKKRDEAFQAKLDKEVEDLRRNLAQKRERDVLLEKQMEEKSRQLAEKRSERQAHTKIVKHRIALTDHETNSRLEEKLQKAEDRRQDRLRQEEEARVVRAMETEVKNEKRHQKLLEKLAHEEESKAKAEARKREFEQHIAQLDDAKREQARYMKLLNQEKQERMAQAYKQSMSDQQQQKEKQLAKLQRQAQEAQERTARAQRQQELRAVEKELAFQEKEEAAQQAKRRAQFEADVKGVRLNKKLARIEETRMMKMMEVAEHRTNLHKLHIAKSKLAPLEQPMFPTTHP